MKKISKDLVKVLIEDAIKGIVEDKSLSLENVIETLKKDFENFGEGTNIDDDYFAILKFQNELGNNHEKYYNLESGNDFNEDNIKQKLEKMVILKLYPQFRNSQELNKITDEIYNSQEFNTFLKDIIKKSQLYYIEVFKEEFKDYNSTGYCDDYYFTYINTLKNWLLKDNNFEEYFDPKSGNCINEDGLKELLEITILKAHPSLKNYTNFKNNLINEIYNSQEFNIFLNDIIQEKLKN